MLEGLFKAAVEVGARKNMLQRIIALGRNRKSRLARYQAKLLRAKSNEEIMADPAVAAETARLEAAGYAANWVAGTMTHRKTGVCLPLDSDVRPDRHAVIVVTHDAAAVMAMGVKDDGTYLDGSCHHPAGAHGAGAIAHAIDRYTMVAYRMEGQKRIGRVVVYVTHNGFAVGRKYGKFPGRDMKAVIAHFAAKTGATVPCEWTAKTFGYPGYLDRPHIRAFSRNGEPVRFRFGFALCPRCGAVNVFDQFVCCG